MCSNLLPLSLISPLPESVDPYFWQSKDLPVVSALAFEENQNKPEVAAHSCKYISPLDVIRAGLKLTTFLDVDVFTLMWYGKLL